MVRQLLTIAVMTLSVSNISFGQQSAFEVADTALNNNYQALMQTLPTAEQALLRDAQRLWIRYTDAKCRFEVALDEKQFANCKSKETLKRSQEFSTLLASQKEAAKMKREFSTQLKDVLTNIESIPVEEYDRIYWPGGSAHTIVTQFLKKISLNYVVNQYGKPIFLEGPHSETVVNLESTTEFGHYDPAFLSWLDQHLTQILGDEEFVASTKAVVDRYLLGTVELYLSSYYYLTNNPDIRDSMMLDYIVQYQNGSLGESHHMAFFVPSNRIENPNWDGETKSAEYIWVYPEATTQFDWILTNLNERWEYVPVGSSLFFWMRRAIDGTDQQFVDLMTKFYRAYHPEDLAKIENKAYQAPRELPGGKIKF